MPPAPTSTSSPQTSDDGSDVDHNGLLIQIEGGGELEEDEADQRRPAEKVESDEGEDAYCVALRERIRDSQRRAICGAVANKDPSRISDSGHSCSNDPSSSSDAFESMPGSFAIPGPGSSTVATALTPPSGNEDVAGELEGGPESGRPPQRTPTLPATVVPEAELVDREAEQDLIEREVQRRVVNLLHSNSSRSVSSSSLQRQMLQVADGGARHEAAATAATTSASPLQQHLHLPLRAEAVILAPSPLEDERGRSNNRHWLKMLIGSLFAAVVAAAVVTVAVAIPLGAKAARDAVPSPPRVGETSASAQAFFTREDEYEIRMARDAYFGQEGWFLAYSPAARARDDDSVYATLQRDRGGEVDRGGGNETAINAAATSSSTRWRIAPDLNGGYDIVSASAAGYYLSAKPFHASDVRDGESNYVFLHAKGRSEEWNIQHVSETDQYVKDGDDDADVYEIWYDVPPGSQGHEGEGGGGVRMGLSADRYYEGPDPPVDIVSDTSTSVMVHASYSYLWRITKV